MNWLSRFRIRLSTSPRLSRLVAVGSSTVLVSSAYVGAGCAPKHENETWFHQPWTSFQSPIFMPDPVPGFDRVFVMRKTPYTVALMTILRDEDTEKEQFMDVARKISLLVFSEAMCLFPYKPRVVTTPVDGAVYTGLEPPDAAEGLCLVSVLRAADAMAEVASAALPAAPVGKILIQRDENTAEARLLFSRLPPDVAGRRVLLLDPMLASGGSAAAAVRVLKEAGVEEEAVVVACLVAAPEGLRRLVRAHPQVRVVVGEVDRGLNRRQYILPGLGDFGDRFYGTPPAE